MLVRKIPWNSQPSDKAIPLESSALLLNPANGLTDQNGICLVTRTGVVPCVSGPNNTIYDFSGSSSNYISVSGVQRSFTPTGGVTILAVVEARSAASYPMFVSSYAGSDTAAAGGLEIRLNAATGRLEFSGYITGVGYFSILSSATIVNTGLRTVVARYTASGAKLWMDGVLIGTQSFTANPVTWGTHDWKIGGRAGSNGYPLTGAVGAIEVLSNALEDSICSTLSFNFWSGRLLAANTVPHYFATGQRIHYVVYPASESRYPQAQDVIDGWPGVGVTSDYQLSNITENVEFQVEATGLTASTAYKIAYVWYDGNNVSDVVVSAEFTTAAGSGGPTVYTLAIDVGGYDITGVITYTLANRQLPLEVASYDTTGVDAFLTLLKIFLLDPGSYDITGVTNNILAGRVLSADPSTYDLTGANASTLYNRLLSVIPDNYTLSGVDDNMLASRLLKVDPAALDITGVSAGTLASRKLDVVPSVYDITLFEAKVLASRLLKADPSSYGVSEVAVNELASRRLPNEVGSYSLTGDTLEFVLASSGFNLDTGSYGITGFDAALIASRKLNLEPTTFDLTGNATAVLYNRTVNVTPGQYDSTGTDASTRANRLLNTEIGSLDITGSSAGTLASRLLNTAVGAYDTSGIITSLTASRLIDAVPGTYDINAVSTFIVTNRVLSTTPGQYDSVGVNPGLIFVPTGGLIVYPDAADVRAGLVYGPANTLTGTWRFNPSANLVTSGTEVQSNNYIVIGVYGVSGSLPNASDVRKGIQYGLNGTQLTGTAIGFLSLDTTTAKIIKPVTESAIISV